MSSISFGGDSMGNWLRSLLTMFGVGLIPYVGLTNVPFFNSLLSLYPDSMRMILVPAAALVMGLSAAVTRYISDTTGSTTDRRRRRIWIGVAVVTAGIIAVCILNVLYIERVEVATRSAATVIIWKLGDRLEECECDREYDNETCIKKLPLSKAEESGCWFSAMDLRLVQCIFVLVYLGTAIGFGVLVVSIRGTRKNQTLRTVRLWPSRRLPD